MLVGAVQSLANWWADHQEVPRAADRRDDDGLRLARPAATQPGRALAGRRPVNFARDVVDAADPRRLALVALARDGERREIAFGEVADRSARLAGALAARGVRRGDVGHDPDRQPARVGLRDGRLLAARRRRRCRAPSSCGRPTCARAWTRSSRARSWPTSATSSWPRKPASTGRCWSCRTSGSSRPTRRRAAELGPEDPALIVFTSGTAGEPKPIRHGARYLEGQRVQAEHWYGARPGDLVLVHGRERLVAVGAQRVRGRLAARRRRAAARRPLRRRTSGSS